MLFEKWESMFYKHQNDENVEIEIRFGKMNRGTFDTNIGKDTFEKGGRLTAKIHSHNPQLKTQNSFVDFRAKMKLYLRIIGDLCI